MKLFAWGVLLLGAVGVWHLGGKLSPDALGMMIGLIFGALAGIPAALLTLYAVRNSPPAETPPTPHTRWIIVEHPAEYPAGARTGNVYSEEREAERLGRWPARRHKQDSYSQVGTIDSSH
jgi:hypothetical protein